MYTEPQIARDELRRVQANIEKLGEKKLELERKQLELDTEILEAKRAEDEAFLIYAQSKSHALANVLYTALPRELRDEIYMHLWHDVDTKRHLYRLASRGFARTKGEKDVLQLPFFALPEHMGTTMADEILARLYRDTFAIGPRSFHSIFIERFLAYDQFGRGFRAIDWVKELTINWQYGEENQKQRESLKASMKIPKEHTFAGPIILEVKLDGHSRLKDSLSSIVDKLEILKSTYYALTAQGHTVKIIESHWKTDVSDYYNMFEKAWVEKLNAIVEDTG